MKVVAKLRQRGEKDQPPKLLCYIKWLKNVVIFFFCFFFAKNLGWSDDAKRRKKRDGLNSSPRSQSRYVSQEPDKEGFSTRRMKSKYSVKYYNKIKKPTMKVSCLKSTLFYSANDKRLTFFPWFIQLTQGDHVSLMVA